MKTLHHILRSARTAWGEMTYGQRRSTELMIELPEAIVDPFRGAGDERTPRG